MNEAEINFEPTSNGFYGYFRLPHKSERIYVTDGKKNPILFRSSFEAKATAADAFRAAYFGLGIRGERLSSDGAVSKADALFPKLRPGRPKVVKQKGKTRRIDVEIA